MTAIAEAYILAKASGVDPAQVRAALMGGFAGSRILEVHGERMLSGNFTPGFKTRLHQKDLAIVMQQAAALGLDLAATQLSQHYLESVTDGELDSAAIYQAIERAQGI
ncbi:MAG: 2-hydroxy-3-oxopropionate reductase [Halothiobacillaceae bacterium]|nr:MAG: 2-hydroxy-3-oxopropionate reductase [Halothiobacillaceae bacterium]